MKDLTYRDTIKYLASTKSTKLFGNKGVNYAEIVLSEIFNSAKEEVLIFAGNKKGDVTNSDTYCLAIENYINNTDGVIKVFLENGRIDDSFKVYKKIKDYKEKNPNRVDCKEASEKFLSDVNDFFKNRYHFIVADKRMFRVETEPDTYKAICSFNSSDFANNLRNLFLKHFNQVV